jgi:hypothetical protein
VLLSHRVLVARVHAHRLRSLEVADHRINIDEANLMCVLGTTRTRTADMLCSPVFTEYANELTVTLELAIDPFQVNAIEIFGFRLPPHLLGSILCCRYSTESFPITFRVLLGVHLSDIILISRL